jgi:ATP-dependent protease ClpP protease subunit
MAEISIVGGIGVPDSYGRVVLHEDVAQALLALPDDTTDVTVRINSPGGLVHTGRAIIETLNASGLTIHTRGEEIVGSIATAIFMVGKTRSLYPSTLFNIHNPYAEVQGDAAYLRQHAEQLDQLQGWLSDFYSASTGLPVDLVAEMMRKDSVMTGSEALEFGFATQVIQPAKSFLQPFTQIYMNWKQKLSELLKQKALTVTLADGAEVAINDMDATDVAVGMPANLPDGETALADGRVLVVEDSVITDILTPEESIEVTEEEMAAIAEALSALMAKVNGLEMQVKALSKAQGVGVSKPAPGPAAKAFGTQTPDPLNVPGLKKDVAERLMKIRERLEKHNN